jgi:Raf kinase inhibitor-like YbhB/YbcL family protein
MLARPMLRTFRIRPPLVVGLALLALSLPNEGLGTGGDPMAFSLTSPAFEHQSQIPTLYTCEGDDVSPPLAWSGAPAGTRTLVLIVDDPDAPDPKAPKLTWVHWVLYNLPADSTGLPEAVAERALPKGTRVGRNDWKREDYGGPCPPIGRHRYFHKLYALDTKLPERAGLTKAEVEKAMQGHVLGQTELVGVYQKKKA